MKIRYLLLLLAPSAAIAWEPLVEPNTSVVPHDQTYYTTDVRNTRLIYTEQNREDAEHAAAIEMMLQPLYEGTFGYQMDTRLSVGLVSSYNQIANGFSTQFPLNRQINYIGGALTPDYFASNSWLNTLLLHETAHNYQINAKDNAVSSGLFSVLRNGFLYFPVVPAIVPNMTESSFMLEGNAVLNESWHGQGGRLYSGRYRAMTNVHAQADNLTAERMYNRTLNFPYGEGLYVFGSDYQYYLAETYGLEANNKYFKNRSKFWYWPFVVNAPMRMTVGENFDTTMVNWAQKTKADSAGIQLAQGKVIATSKFFSGMNTQNDDVLFQVSPKGVRAPLMVRYHKADGTIEQKRTGHANGKVVEVDDELYTLGSARTSVWRTYQGLFDENLVIKEDTKGKAIQGYLSNGKEVYFNVEESYVRPKMYVGDEFYAEVNSSVVVHNDDLYYFIQDGRQRSLYKNKERVYSFDAYYAMVVDVDSSGAIYFIANSEFGSSLYRTSDGSVQRVIDADNVIDARLANDNQVIVAAISEDNYYYSLESIAPVEQAPYVVKLLWDDEGGLADQQAQQFAELEPQNLGLDTKYGFFRNVRYNAGSLTFGTAEVEDPSTGEKELKATYSLAFEFADPLTRSQYSIWMQRDDDQSDLAGVGFSNNQFFLLAGVKAYHVIGSDLEDFVPPVDLRENGIAAELRLPFLERGYWKAELAATYFQDYKLYERKPVVADLAVSRTEYHGNSMFANKQFAIDGYSVDDRGDQITGGQFKLMTDLPAEFYVSLTGKVSDSDAGAINQADRRGVEIDDGSDFINGDSSKFIIPSIKENVFARRVTYGELSMSKVINASKYFLKFPVSMRRQAITLAARHYQIDESTLAGDVEVNQAVLGVTFDVLMLNVVPFQFSFEAVHNDNVELTERTQVSATANMPF